jgi:propanol-preferring alcohol dehydrogenase
VSDAGLRAAGCVGAEETIQLGFSLLAIEGAFVSVGLVGDRISIPLFPFVAREYSYFGSFLGSFNDMSEVVELVQEGKINHSVEKVRFEDVNEALNRLGAGDVEGAPR